MSVVSPNRTICLLHFGNALATPPTPANLTVFFTQQYDCSSTPGDVRIVLANVLNPPTAGLNTGILATVNFYCETQQNLPCSQY